jgi:hypothetical protein
MSQESVVRCKRLSEAFSVFAMRRVGLVLAISAVALALSPGPAAAQSEEPTFGCIPTSDTPFQTGFVGPLPEGTALVLYAGPAGVPPTIFGSSDVAPDGTASFPAGLAPGTYGIAFLGELGFIQPLGTLQIGGCKPTDREQCKGEGWRAFDFENQGQCVASVVRHGS